MSRNARLAYSDATWNPVRGCTRASEGCRHCYAEEMAARYGGKGKPYEGLAIYTPSGPRWTGEVRLAPDQLLLPLHWRRPQKVFVGSMSDLFHEQLEEAAIDAVFATMRAADWHTYQILTKRPGRMADYVKRNVKPGSRLARALWLGVSCEDQATLHTRWPLLAPLRVGVRFVSAAPLLGPITLAPSRSTRRPRPDWVVAAGETGPRARPADLAWFHTLQEQCAAEKLPFFLLGIGSALARSTRCRDCCGETPADWPPALRVRELPPSPQASCPRLAARRARAQTLSTRRNETQLTLL